MRYLDTGPGLDSLIHSRSLLRRHILHGRWEFQYLSIFTYQQADKPLLSIQMMRICLTLFGMTSLLGIGAKYDR